MMGPFPQDTGSGAEALKYPGFPLHFASRRELSWGKRFLSPNPQTSSPCRSACVVCSCLTSATC